jgi:hypothetical protein
MRKLLRDVVAVVRQAGGTDVRVSEGGKHTRIHFTGPEGRRSIVLIHRGNAVCRWFPTMIRRQILRKLAK